MIADIAKWILADLRLDAQLMLEDAELIHLGYSFSEVQQMTMTERQRRLAASQISAEFRRLTDRRARVDASVASGGFTEKKVRMSILRRWDDEADRNMRDLSEFCLEAAERVARVRPKKTRSFKDVLASQKAKSPGGQTPT